MGAAQIVGSVSSASKASEISIFEGGAMAFLETLIVGVGSKYAKAELRLVPKGLLSGPGREDSQLGREARDLLLVGAVRSFCGFCR